MNYRLTFYSRLFSTCYLIIMLVYLTTFNNLLDRQGTPLGADFMSFWSAGHLASQKKPELGYQWEQILKTSKRVIPENNKHYIWSYPPPFYFITLPLGKTPYLLALAIWSMAGFFGTLYLLYRLLPDTNTIWLSIGFLPFFINLLQGQNAYLSTMLLAGAFLTLHSRPMIAGLLIGLLSYKPQLGLIIPFALLAGRYYRVFASAAATVVVLNCLAYLAFGLPAYQAFLHNLHNAHQLIEPGLLPIHKMPSFFASLRWYGLSGSTAFSIHYIIACIVTVSTVYTWRKSPSAELKFSALILGALLVTHHLNDYDLTLMLIPILLLTRNGLNNGWAQGEKTILTLAWLSPVLIVLGYHLLKIQAGPFLLACFFFYSTWRSTRHPNIDKKSSHG